MWLGTITKETPEDEKERVGAFFADLEKPFEHDAEAASEQASPFSIIGFTIAALGCVMIAVAVIVLIFYNDSRAFSLDLIIGGFMLVLGLLMRLGGKSQEFTYGKHE